MSETPLEYDAKENTKNIGKPALKLSDTVPKLVIEQYDDVDGGLYALCGWDSLYKFGYRHSNAWRQTVGWATHYGLQDEDMLKVLIRNLLEENLSLHERLQEMIIRCGVPIKQCAERKEIIENDARRENSRNH